MDTISQFNFSIEHIQEKKSVIADVLSRCEHKETEIPTSKYHSPPSPSHSTTSSLPFYQPHFTHFPTNSPTNSTNIMPSIISYKKAPTPGPSRRRSFSPLFNLAEMWERTSNPPTQAVYSANVQTRAQAQRGRSVTR